MQELARSMAQQQVHSMARELARSMEQVQERHIHSQRQEQVQERHIHSQRQEQQRLQVQAFRNRNRQQVHQE